MKIKYSLSVATMLVVAVNSEVFISSSAQTNSTNTAIVPARSFLGMGGITTTPERKASLHFHGNEIPEPPQQKLPWTLSLSALPTNYLRATALLFQQGLADPRGCDYQEIEVGTGEIWQGDGGIIKTHGWILTGQTEPRFAVCWNGLVYPVASIGDAADWRADVQAATKNAGRQWRSALPEAYEVSYETAQSLKGCLILRLGDAKLAEDFWLAIQAGAQRDLKSMYDRSGVTNSSDEATAKLDEADPYLNWASDWAWDLFERAVCAHMRGDDHLALVSSRLLTSVRPKIEAAAEQRGFKRQPTFSSPSDGKYQDYVNFLGPLPVLLADQERRAQSRKPVQSLATITNLASQPERIAALIENLDQVAVRQWGQPGGLGPWETDPVVAALLKEGQPAIEPLLKFLEGNDANRLTRSVSFGRDFHRGRTLHPISQPVVTILLKLMNTSDAAVGFDRSAMYYGSVSNNVLAAKFRSYWETFGQLSPPERWYRKLADDKAGDSAWKDTLGNIVRSEPFQGNTNTTQLAGEGLRSKTSSSVTELLVRRAETIEKSESTYNARYIPACNPFAVGEATSFLLNVEKWEAPPSLIALARDLQSKVRTGYEGTQNYGSADHQNATSIAALAMLRARHGDTNSLDDFAAWIEKAKPDVLEESALDALEPFWRFPNYPALRSAAQAMFGNTNSPWGNLAWILKDRGSYYWGKPLASPALIIPEVRTIVLNELTNHSSAGEAVNRGGGNLEVKYASGSTTYFGARKDTEGLEVGAKFTFRRCDVVAEQLSVIPGFPKISLLWPEEKRDEAVFSTVRLLETSGHRLRAKERPSHWSSAFDPPLIELPEADK
jgi:hypothetical protein